MTSTRAAFALAALVGCARGPAEDLQQLGIGPVQVELDASPAVPVSTSDASMPLNAVVPDAARGPELVILDAGGTLERDAGPGLDAAVTADASSTPTEPTPPDANPPAPDGPPRGTLILRMVAVGTTTRSYLLYVPPGLDVHTPVPLVSVHHPFGQDGEYMATITSWRRIADREKFVVAFPNGSPGGSPWYVGEGVCNWGTVGNAPSTQDDIAFELALVLDVLNTQTISTRQVFVAGLSMGGYFANHIACKGRELVRAVAAHSAGTYPGDCQGTPVPVMLIHGDADSLIPLQCAKEALGYWVARNACSDSTISDPVKLGECRWNTGCPSGQEVGLCTMKGMDHGWAGAAVTGNWLQFQYGGGEQFEDAAEMMWKFFKNYL